MSKKLRDIVNESEYDSSLNFHRVDVSIPVKDDAHIDHIFDKQDDFEKHMKDKYSFHLEHSGTGFGYRDMGFYGPRKLTDKEVSDIKTHAMKHFASDHAHVANIPFQTEDPDYKDE